MIGLVASEVRKLSSTVTTWVMTAIGLGLIALGAGLSLLVPGAGAGEFQGTDAQVGYYVDQVGSSSIIVLIVALLSMTTEFRHGTIGRTLQITPSRTRVLLSKLTGATVYALAFLVAGLVLVSVLLLVGSMVTGTGVQPGSETLEAVWFGVVGLVLTAWFGVALGALIRSQVVAITVTLVWMFVVETAVGAFAPSVGQWMPFNALNAVFVSDEALEAMGGAGPQLLAPMTGLAVFIGYTVVSAAAAVVLMRTRDV